MIKRSWLFTGLFILILSTTAHGQNYLLNPESVVFDSLYNRYLASNFGGAGIIAIDTTGHQSIFTASVTNTAGLHIVGDTLYSASSSFLTAIDLHTGNVFWAVKPTGAVLLNDITSDTSGNLYVTDSDGDNLIPTL